MDKPKLWSNEWFLCWQPLLLLGVNSPFKGMREDVRRRLGIDLDRNILIDRLLRNSFRIKVGDNQYQETFYTLPRFAINIKREWNWLWNLIHKWDMNFANNLIPRLNLGFDTLTAYPDPDPETTTVDGWVRRSGVDETMSNIRSGEGVGSDTSSSSGYVFQLRTSTGTVNQYTTLARGVFLFDTSSLLGTAIISSANLSLYGAFDDNVQFPFSYKQAQIVSATPANNTTLSASDYSNVGSVSFGSIDFTDSGGYNTGNIDNTSVSKAGITKFACRYTMEFNNTNPPDWDYGKTVHFSCRNSDYSGTSNDPKLVVTYTFPATFVPQINII